MAKKDKKISLIEKIEQFFKDNRWKIGGFALFLSIVFSIFLFDLKVSIGGDDSTYILVANNFIKGLSFPSWHGAFYPIFLSFFMKIFGLNLILFKVLSLLMIVTHLILFYFTFRQRVSWSVLILSILYLSVCLELLYFGGQTYSEALFILLQILVFASFFRLYDSFYQKEFNLFREFKQWLVFGFTLFLLVITRNIGWVMLFTAMLYFILAKQFKRSLKTFLYFFLFYFPFFIYKLVFWGEQNAGVEGQVGRMFWINPYDRNEGLESLGGFVSRFIENSEQYLSAHLLNIFSWTDTSTNNPIATIIVYVILAVVAYFIVKRNKQLFFIYLYVVFGLIATFVSQQVMWNQFRLVLIFVPYIVLMFAQTLWNLLPENKSNIFKYLALIFLFSLIIPSTIKIINSSVKHFPVLKANIKGDKYFGYTKDWQNYLKMTEWVSTNIPKKAVVACRKPGMAFIYGNGRTFAGIYSVQTFQIEDVFENLKLDPTKYNFFIDFRTEGKKFFSLYPFFYYISFIVNNSDGRQFITFSLDENTVHLFYATIASAGLNPLNLDQMKSLFSVKRANDYVVYPDSLLNYLKNSKIDYLIAGHLRKEPERKSINFITTMYRYIYFIEMKYPGIFDVVWQIGDENDENSILVKVDYEKTKLKPIKFE